MNGPQKVFAMQLLCALATRGTLPTDAEHDAAVKLAGRMHGQQGKPKAKKKAIRRSSSLPLEK